MKVYLCGGINGLTDSECKDWREYSKTKLSNTLDPMRRDYRGREDDCRNEIVELDKIDIDLSDALLVWYPKPSTGTDMEIFYAWEGGKQIYVVVPRESKISPWLKYHSDYITESLDGAIAQIQFVDKTTKEKNALSEVLGQFSREMLYKMFEKQKRGVGGWADPSCLVGLKESLKEHIEKGDMIDVANIAMFIWNLEGNKYLKNLPKVV